MRTMPRFIRISTATKGTTTRTMPPFIRISTATKRRVMTTSRLNQSSLTTARTKNIIGINTMNSKRISNQKRQTEKKFIAANGGTITALLLVAPPTEKKGKNPIGTPDPKWVPGPISDLPCTQSQWRHRIGRRLRQLRHQSPTMQDRRLAGTPGTEI